MSAHVASMTDEPMASAQTEGQRLRAAALGGLTALLGIAFLLLLVADQAQGVAGVP